MNKLSAEERAHILHLLCEGMSIRAVTRTTGASKNTVTRLLNDAGRALGDYQDRVFRDLQCRRVQVDEIWSFTYAKQKNVAGAVSAPEGAGDTWTWTAICADSKLVMSWLVGSRDAGSAYEFIEDVYGRLANRVQLTSDGLGAYINAVRDIFGIDVDFAQLVKIYGSAPEAFKGRYSPAPMLGARKTRIEGRPDPAHVSTSYVERQNLTMRMHMRRFTRLTNGFSKKVENHANAVSLHFAYYNFVRIHKTLRVTPAMAAGVTDRLWEMADLVAVLEAAEEAPKKRGPYKKRG
ncbi:MAG: helix-turn-helix domain-containing protein [Brevundimonas sp.]|uniref:helix-turn-helix domain-containing protein n=1 Tax=Brevundimonas sp. TaxID=1871086 RepID=UPI003001619C